jgi:multisubunit Na+/H+ antiporter MnhB subunit
VPSARNLMKTALKSILVFVCYFLSKNAYAAPDGGILQASNTGLLLVLLFIAIILLPRR